MTRRLAFAVGDTAGHVNPALAIADTYHVEFPDVDVVFFAADGGPASRLVPAAGYDLEFVPASSIVRTGAAGKVAAMARVVPCMALAARLLRTRGSRLVIGSGGYATGGVLLAARMLGLRTAVLEPNVELGLANRLLRRAAHRAYVTYPETARHFPPRRAVVTGTPVRRQAAPAMPGPPRPSTAGVRLLVTSGSRGDAFFAARVPPLLASLRSRGVDLEVLHQAGDAGLPRLQAEYERLSLAASVVSRIDDMATAYAWATFAITRAGAGTLAELSLAGLPSLLVPLADAAADHQAANAKRFADEGAALWIREAEWDTDAVAGRLFGVMDDPTALTVMAGAARRLARPNAANDIVRDCEAVMSGRW